MPAPSPTEPSPDSPSEIVRELPRWGFWKGLLVGTILEIPAISAAVFLLPRLGLGLGAAVPAMTVVRMTSLFAGLPALVTSGGIGRLAAHESVKRRRRAAIAWAAGVHALAGAMLTFIAALPHGYLPARPLAWAALVIAGMAAGALCGAVIGVACTGAPPRQVAEMLELVKRPGMTLRQLIESEDLGRIGAAVRHRAALMFDGLLDPAEPRPDERAEEQRDELGNGQEDDGQGDDGGAEREAAAVARSEAEVEAGSEAGMEAAEAGAGGARGTGEPRA